jgi:hypothetical protein
MNIAYIIANPQQIPFVAVGVSRMRHGNTHTGVVYRHSNGQVHYFHQAWDHDTRDGEISAEVASLGGTFLSVMVVLEDVRARAVALSWEIAASRNKDIGYALADDPDALFDPHTGILVLPNGRGLSCSTFVLALLRSARIPWINTKEWPANNKRAGDREWLEFLVKRLEETCQDKEHVERVRQEVRNGCIRVRPEEVAGAGLYEHHPVCFPMAAEGGEFTLARLNKVPMTRRPLPTIPA